MKILIISATYPPSANGVAISTSRSVQVLRSMGHEVAVIAPDVLHDKDPEYFGLPTIKFPFFGLKDYPLSIPALSARQIREISRTRWDILHVHHPFMFGDFAIKLGKKLSAPVVFTYHTQYDKVLASYSWLPPWAQHLIYRRYVLQLLRSFDGVIATTQWLHKDLCDVVDNAEKVHYVSTAGLLHSFRSDAGLAGTIYENRLTLREPIFLAVSRLSIEKNPDILLESFLSWAECHETGNLIVIGDGGYRRHLEQLANVHPQGARIAFMGRIPNADLPSWYSMATAFLYTSTNDTIGINIIEAMSAGLPVVAPRHATTAEVITDNYNGILTEASPEAMSHGMEAAVLERERLSAGAYATSKEFDAKRLTSKLVEAYAAIIAAYQWKNRRETSESSA